MGLVTAILGLPLAPIRGVIKLGELIQDRVELELRDPSTARRDLEAAEDAAAKGEISPEREAEIQDRVLRRMIATPGSDQAAAPDSEPPER